MGDFIEASVKKIREEVGSKQVILVLVVEWILALQLH